MAELPPPPLNTKDLPPEIARWFSALTAYIRALEARIKALEGP